MSDTTTGEITEKTNVYIGVVSAMDCCQMKNNTGFNTFVRKDDPHRESIVNSSISYVSKSFSRDESQEFYNIQEFRKELPNIQSDRTSRKIISFDTEFIFSLKEDPWNHFSKFFDLSGTNRFMIVVLTDHLYCLQNEEILISEESCVHVNLHCKFLDTYSLKPLQEISTKFMDWIALS